MPHADRPMVTGRHSEGCRREGAGADVGSPFAFDFVAAFDPAFDNGDGRELWKARGARIGALGRVPIDLVRDAVVANLETAVLLVDGLALLAFGPRRGCKIAFDFGMERRLVVLDGQKVVSPGIEDRLGDGDLAAHGIRRDQGTLEIEPLDQRRNSRDLVGFFKYRLL